MAGFEETAAAVEEETARVRFARLTLPSVCAYIGFGFFCGWLLLGLYEGYPIFRSGEIDSVSCITVMGGFSLALIACAFAAPLRERMGSWGVQLGGALCAMLGNVVLILIQLDLWSISLETYIVLVRAFLFFVGAGTGVLLACFGHYFAALEPASSLTTFCVSFLATFFSFFWINSLNFPFSCYLISLYPLICAACLRKATAEVEPVEAAGERGFSRGYLRMLVAFAVYTFAASLTQSLEPQKDFALSLDEGVISFFFVAMLILYLLMFSKREFGTFTILKRAYQVSTILLVCKFIVQPLASDDSYFAALNFVTYMSLFMVFWVLTAFVAHSADIRPVKAFALVFGLAGLCMAAGWVVGVALYSLYGHERYYVSIAAGCMVTVFCTFGFSLKDFPLLIMESKGTEKTRKGEAEAGEPAPKKVTTEMAVAAIEERCKLSQREQEIFEMLVRGMSTEAIAEELVISYYTVRTHIRNIYAKLGVSSRNDLFVLVMQYETGLSQGGIGPEGS